MDNQLYTNKIFPVFLFLILLLSVTSYQINLDDLPEQRFKSIAKDYSQDINKFIDYLYTVTKYKICFRTVSLVEMILPSYAFQWLFESQFYEECKGIAQSIKRKVSEVIVFNYMYELGAYKQFCTSIPVSVRDQSGNLKQSFLARNLDYGYQEYLGQSSMIINYYHNGTLLYQSAGHAGLIGVHTALHKGKMPFSISMNQRTQGGLHLTLWQIITSRCNTVPFLYRKLLIQNFVDQEQIISWFKSMKTCAAVFVIINFDNGQNVVIEKDRGIGVSAVYRNGKQQEGTHYFVQTNTDRDKRDPDTRRTTAQNKIKKLLKEKKQLNPEAIRKILLDPPNFNNKTLMTVVANTKNSQMTFEVWK